MEPSETPGSKTILPTGPMTAPFAVEWSVNGMSIRFEAPTPDGLVEILDRLQAGVPDAFVVRSD